MDAVTGENSLNLCMADEYPDDMYYLLKNWSVRNKIPRGLYMNWTPPIGCWSSAKVPHLFSFTKNFLFQAAKISYFFDKVMRLDFRSSCSLAPWGYYRNEYTNIGKNIRVKQSEAYKNYDPSVLEIGVGHYGGKGFIYRDRIEGEAKGGFNNVPFEEDRIQDKAIQYFEKMAEYCKKKGIELVVITTPVPKDTTDAFADSYEKADQYFRDLLSGYGLEYLNFNLVQPEILSRSMEGYWDYDGHMDGIRAEEFSTVLGNVLDGCIWKVIKSVCFLKRDKSKKRKFFHDLCCEEISFYSGIICG